MNERLQEINSRLSEIKRSLDAKEEGMDIDALREEIAALKEERNKIESEEAQRQERLKDIANNNIPTQIVEERKEENTMPEFKNDSAEYRSAWLKNLMGKELTEQERLVDLTGAMPTSTANKVLSIVEESKLLSKLDISRIPGNLNIPVETASDAASWGSTGAAVNDAIGTVQLYAYQLIKTIEVPGTIKAASIDAFEDYIVRRLGEKIRKTLELAVINGDGSGKNTDKCEIRQDKDGTAYLRYEIKDGVYAAIELERAGRMVNMQYDSEIFGASNRCMLPTMQMISQQSQSVLEGAKNAASLRFMARIATVLKPDQLKEERKRFNEENLGADNNNGVLLFDEKYEDVKQITSTPYAVPDAQMEQIRQNVFDYFGVNANILQNKFTSQEWEAFYEGAIEPFAVQLSQVHTGMVYSVRQVGFGNEILWTGDRLHHMSTQEKTTLIATLFDRGFITHNEGREILNLAPVEGGGKFYIRKEYAETGSVEDDGEGVLDSNTGS